MTEDIFNKIKSSTNDTNIEIGLIVGSGLSNIISKNSVFSISYDKIPNFPNTTISGHKGKLEIVKIKEKYLAVLNGRNHYYESGDASSMFFPIKFMKKIGIKKIFITNAAGSLRKKITPGSIMLIEDHINLTGQNPFVGFKNEKVFVDMVNAYDKNLRKNLIEIAKKERIKVFSGIYAWLSGPTFETPAEIKMLKKNGVNAVGMSTVPEVIISRFFNMKIIGISVITNYAAGMSIEKISHDQTKLIAPEGGKKIKKILYSFL